MINSVYICMNASLLCNGRVCVCVCDKHLLVGWIDGETNGQTDRQING